MQRVLILCTGNSARSQMAEGLLRNDAGDRFEVESAGTKPGHVRPEAVAVPAPVESAPAVVASPASGRARPGSTPAPRAGRGQRLSFGV